MSGLDADYGATRRGWGAALWDGAMLALLLWPSLGGAWLLGSTRTWGISIGLAACFAGGLMFAVRPLLFRRTATARWAAPPGFWGFALMACYVAWRMGRAAAPYAAGWELLRWGGLLAAYLAWTQLGGERGRWRWLLAVVLCAGAMEAVYALHQHLAHSTGVMWAERPEQYGMRASGSYLCPNHFGNLLAMMVPVAVAVLFLPQAGLALRLTGVYFLPLAVPALYLSQSRSAWLGMLAGVLTVPLFTAWRRSKALFAVALVALPLLGVGTGLLAYATLPAVKERFVGLFDDPTRVSSGRLTVWSDAPEMYRAAPVWGHGPNSYVWAYPPFKQHNKDGILWDYPHNEWIQLALENGAVGFGLVAIAILAAAVRWLLAAGRSREGGGAVLVGGIAGSAVCCLVHGFFDFNFHIFPNPQTLALLAGVGWGAWRSMEGEDAFLAVAASRGTDRWRWVRMAAAVVLAVLCAAGIRETAKRGMSYIWTVRGNLAMESPAYDYDASEAAFARAQRWHAKNPDVPLGLGYLRLTQAWWFVRPDQEERLEGKRALAEEALAAFRHAEALNPCEMQAVTGEGQALAMLKRHDEALAAFRRASDYEPRNVEPRELVGMQLRRMKRYDEALAWFEAAREDHALGVVGHANLRALRKIVAAEKAAAANP